MLAAYAAAGGRGPRRLQVHLSWAPTEDEALAIAHDQWANNVVGPPVAWDANSVEMFDAIGKHIPDEAVRQSVLVSADPARHVDWLLEYLELGFDELYLHFVGQQQSEYIDTFAEQVLPRLNPTKPEIRPSTGRPS